MIQTSPLARFGLVAAALFFAWAGTAAAPPPPESSGDELVLGMSTALTGPSRNLGLNMRCGVEAALAEANRAGGVAGHPLRLISLDDAYEPSRTAPNMRRLIERDHVQAVVGNVGTPTAVVAVPIAMASGTPMYGSFTGAGVLRKTPPDRYVVNFRASYAEETGAMVDALSSEAGVAVDRIAFFTQRDAYGDAGFAGGIAALKRHGLTDEHRVVHTRYERNTTAVESALAEVMLAEPEPQAVIMVGAYAPCAEFIRSARRHEIHVYFLNVSFVGAVSLARELGSDGDGVIITQVVPHFEADLPIAREYRRALTAWQPGEAPDFGSFEGYISARVFLRALGGIEGPIGRERIVEALEGLGTFDLGLGAPLHLGRDDHQACHTVWPTVIRGGRVVPFDWSELHGPRRAEVR
jgi:branched-chain amino acid transport system substrate-binding protein